MSRRNLGLFIEASEVLRTSEVSRLQELRSWVTQNLSADKINCAVPNIIYARFARLSSAIWEFSAIISAQAVAGRDDVGRAMERSARAGGEAKI